MVRVKAKAKRRVKETARVMVREKNKNGAR
jgi:hypothetical protein